MKPIYEYLSQWNKETDNFSKLQAAYGTLAIAAFLIAGLVSLIQYNIGQSLLFFAIILTLTFIGNGVIWSLLKTFVIPRLDKAAKTTTRKK